MISRMLETYTVDMTKLKLPGYIYMHSYTQHVLPGGPSTAGTIHPSNMTNIKQRPIDCEVQEI